MSLFINSFQLFERGVGVYLRRTDALMTQQVLDLLETGTIVQHGRGKGMTKHMRRALFQRGYRRQILPHDAVDLIIGNPLPLVTQEEGFARATELGVAHRHIVVQFRCQLLAEGNDTLFVPSVANRPHRIII